MAPTATDLDYDPESPCSKLERLIGLKIIDSAKNRPDLWPEDQRRIVIDCIKHMASGTVSLGAQRHGDSNRERYIRLGSAQNDILFCARLEVELEHPELVEHAQAIQGLHRELESINTLR